MITANEARELTNKSIEKIQIRKKAVALNYIDVHIDDHVKTVAASGESSASWRWALTRDSEDVDHNLVGELLEEAGYSVSRTDYGLTLQW